MRSALALTFTLAVLCFLACGDGGNADDPDSDTSKAAYAEKHVTFLNSMDMKEVESGVGPLFEFVTKFQVKNSGDREFAGSFKGYFALPGNRGRVPYLRDFTVGPGGETVVEVMFRHTEDGVSATCTEMVSK